MGDPGQRSQYFSPSMAKVLQGSAAPCPPYSRAWIPHLLLPPFCLPYISVCANIYHPHCSATSRGPRGDTPPPLTCRFSRCPGCSGCSSSTGQHWGHHSPGRRTRGGTDLRRNRPGLARGEANIPQPPLPGCSEHTLPQTGDTGKELGILLLSYPVSIILSILCTLPYPPYKAAWLQVFTSPPAQPSQHKSHPAILWLKTLVQEQL